MEVDFSPTFNKNFNKAPNKIKIAFQLRLGIFVNNPFDITLNNHGLLGEYIGCRSFNVTGDWRVIYKENKEQTGVVLLKIGNHSQLYH